MVLLLFAVCKFCSAQTLNISGNVKDNNNNPIPLVSVTIEKQKNGIATDSSGNFKLIIPKYSKLTFSAVGYKDTIVIIETESPLNIVLRSTTKKLSDVTVTDVKPNSQDYNQIKNDIVQTDFLHYKMENNISTGIGVYEGENVVNNALQSYHAVAYSSSSRYYQGTAFPVFSTKEDTKGSLYLNDSWYNGVVANNYDSNYIDDPKNFYNVNKITGDLVMTRDFKSALAVDKNQIKFFTLFDSLKNAYSFLIVPAINPTLFCQVITLGNAYDIFKLTTTKFAKANFHSDGIASSGNNYDEYINTESYYLLNVQTGNVEKFELKKKTIKQVFANVPKANDYFAQHKNDDLNDDFLKSLGKYVNHESK